MSGEWQPTRLGDLAKIHHGFAFKGKHFTDSGHDLVLTPGNFRIGGGFQIRPGREKYYQGPVPDDYVLAAGDLIITMTDLSKSGDTLGYPARVPSSNRLRFLHNQRLGRVEIVDEAHLDPGFLYYRLCGDDYRQEVLASATGTTVRHTAPTRIESFEFDVPSLPEQQAIAEVLGALDDKIALNRRMNRTLEDMAAALFRSWFVDFDPVVAKADGRAPFGMDAETAALFPDAFVESEEGPIPEGWTVRSLASVGDWLSGGTPRRSRDDYWGGDIPWISAKTLHRACVIGSDRNVTPLGAENGTRVVPPGTLLFVVRGMSLAKELRFGVSDVAVAFNQDLKAILPRDVTTGFLLAWFNAHQNDILTLADAASHGTRRLQTELLEELSLVVPPIKALMALSDRFDDMLAQRFQNARQSRTLAALRDALLPQLLSGTIRLKDAERLVGEA